MEPETSSADVEVFRGSRAASLEFGLVLDAQGLGYERVASDEAWLLLVTPPVAAAAAEELRRYAAERALPRKPPPFRVFSGAGAGAAVYALVLIVVAYCAGNGQFGADWLAAGAIESHGLAAQGWRAVTALTLHLDEQHLLGNLLFGVGIGILAGRTFGPGVAWLGILVAAASGNFVEMLVAPPWHRAVGASTAVFAALGLLAGFGWGQRPLREGRLRERRLYRWAPLFGGVSLLALLGAGGEHVDILGHLLGFGAGVALGVAYARWHVTRRRDALWQRLCGSLALLIVAGAWLLALQHAP